MNETVPLDSLHLDEGNSRTHSARNIESIKASLKRFGQQKPIVVDRKDVVVAGNGTLQAARELGWTELEIRRTELEGNEARAFSIADNRTAELAEWDREILATLVAGLDKELLIGWDAAELAELVETPPAVAVSAQDFPEETDGCKAAEHTCPQCGYEWSGGS